MTSDEQDHLLAAMIRERNKLRQTIASLAVEVSQAKEGMRHAILAINHASHGAGRRAEFQVNFLSADDLAALIKTTWEARDRLAEIEQKLNES